VTAYYNEIDPFAASWLEQLISQGHIAPGVVDRRSIVDVKPSEIAGYTQCHFFAGIGVWSYGLRLAGWSDDRPIWTGSCPCQPFSASGKRGGFDDERHLWPFWQYLIEQCGPAEVVGEQVASKDGYAWLDLVQSDLEGMGYACGAVVSPSAGYGAPHERHRQFFGARVVGVTHDARLEGFGQGYQAAIGRNGEIRPVAAPSKFSILADSDGRNASAEREQRSGKHGQFAANCGISDDGSTGPTNGLWRDADWLFCRDERWRAVEPGTFPLVNGATARMGRLRGYGNAINAYQAKAFIEAFAETIDGTPVTIGGTTSNV